MPASTSIPTIRLHSVAARLAEVAERARTLAERLESALAERSESVLAEPAPPLEFKADLLAGWARAFSSGDLAALERRLSWDGLDLALAARAVGSGDRRTEESLPEWLELAARRFSLGQDCRTGAPGGLGCLGTLDGRNLAEVPFGELWAPLVEAALAEAAEEIEAVAVPRRDLVTLAGALAADVGAAGSRAAHERYLRFRADDGAPGSYDRYVESELSSGLLDFAVEFPVALRQIARLVDTWIASMVELGRRIELDRAALADRFSAGNDPGAVVSVEKPQSDRHHGGRGIFRVRFANGADLVAKPRSLSIEVAWERLLSRLAALGFEELPPAAPALDRGTHGWMEWIGAEELADAESADEWFRRAGALVALAELLGAEDLHAENLVAARGGPVVVDAEMMAQPDRPGVDARQRFAGGLLRRSGADDRIGNWAGLHPVEPRVVTAQALSWRHLGGDGIEPVAGKIVASPLPNAPRIRGSEAGRQGGRQLEPREHAAALLVGHRRTWERLLGSRAELLADDGPLTELAGVSTRLLFRPSQEYATVLDRLKTPRCQRQGTTPGILLEAMARPFATAERAPLAWPLVLVERAMLEVLDVPRFEVGADRLEVEAFGRRVEGLIRRTTRAAIASRLAALTGEEIDRRSVELAEALSPTVGPRISLAPAEGRDARARALALADRLAVFERERARPTPSRSFERRLRELSLYDGEIGRALVLAMADRLDGGDRYPAAGSALAAALERLADDAALADLPIGGLEGTGSVVWGLVALASLRAEALPLLERARRFAEWTGRPGAAPPAVNDLFGGTAGAVLALLALAEATAEDGWRDRAVELGDHLIAAGAPAAGGGISWSGKVEEPALTGFAHGSTGIARALSALWQATGESRFASAVGGALAFERSRFDTRLGDWPVVRQGVAENEERSVAMNAYCHGGAGIALGRALLPAELRDEHFRSEVDLAVAATIRAGTGDFDHLCCGAAGRLAILGEVGLRLGRTDALAASRCGLESLLARPLRLPSSSRARPEVEAGLFRGVTGVAWLGLFAASTGDPAVLDPLALELPSEARERAAGARKSASQTNGSAR
ncbi:MAG: type 2 lanthipeptide synthetase LanM [Thermoanaerobaculia bacterium]